MKEYQLGLKDGQIVVYTGVDATDAVERYEATHPGSIVVKTRRYHGNEAQVVELGRRSIILEPGDPGY